MPAYRSRRTGWADLHDLAQAHPPGSLIGIRILRSACAACWASVAGIDMAHHAGAGIGGEHAIELRRQRRAVGHDTILAWIERPIPTLPVLWMLIQHAPGAAVLDGVFSSGQPAIASEPSSIDSVSRQGEAALSPSRDGRA